MEKRSYVKPFLISEEFVSQEYIAACGYSGGGTVYGWAFREVTDDCKGLATASGNPSGTVIPSPTNVNFLSGLFNLSSDPNTSDTLAGYSGYGWIDSDNDGKVSGGDQITYTYTNNGATCTATANINAYDPKQAGTLIGNGLTQATGGAANPQANTIGNVTGTKNLS